VANYPNNRWEEPSTVFGGTQALSGCSPGVEISPSDAKTQLAAEPTQWLTWIVEKPEVLVEKQSYN